jgi:predicted acetyltransferase
MDLELRRIGEEELPAAWDLTRLAFGIAPERPARWEAGRRTGRLDWGLFEPGGRLVAKATDRDQAHWFGGRLVPATGLAGVVVAPEHRRGGLGRRILTHLLGAARQRGAVIATLFRATPEPYRRLGCEDVGALSWLALPAAALAAVPRPDVAVRAAEPGDVPALAALYGAVARAGAGLIDRSGPLYAGREDALLADHDGVSVALGPGGEIAGYAAWDRGQGHEAAGRLRVQELLAATGPATAALLAVLAGWADVAPTLVLRMAEPDPVALLANLTAARLEQQDRWMLRVLDAPGAVAARGWPPHLAGEAELRLEDGTCPWNTGNWRLVLEGGDGRLEPGGRGALRLAVRGFAALYAGSAGPALLRRSGFLAGGGPEDDAFLQAAAAGPAPTLLDPF